MARHAENRLLGILWPRALQSNVRGFPFGAILSTVNFGHTHTTQFYQELCPYTQPHSGFCQFQVGSQVTLKGGSKGGKVVQTGQGITSKREGY